MRDVGVALPVVLTEHALRRMAERAMEPCWILDIIGTGTVKPAEATPL